MHPATPDLLEAIVAATRKRVDTRRVLEPYGALEARAAKRRPRGDMFREVLTRSGGWNVIAECKRRSPSRGVLRTAYDPVAIAAAYEQAGAAAISVLTEPTFFDGALAHLEAVRRAVECPLLRKDFIVEEYQLVEAAAAGADAALLIVAALADPGLTRLHRAAAALGLAALVEVHDVDELDRAVTCGAQIIGVNNRNLRTLEVDIRASETIAARMPAGIVAVSESGLKTAEDLESMRACGYHAFLIGERFMTAADPGKALAQLVATGARGGVVGSCPRL
jgi:indole-3-glycerol phosphate synthase